MTYEDFHNCAATIVGEDWDQPNAQLRVWVTVTETRDDKKARHFALAYNIEFSSRVRPAPVIVSGGAPEEALSHLRKALSKQLKQLGTPPKPTAKARL